MLRLGIATIFLMQANVAIAAPRSASIVSTSDGRVIVANTESDSVSIVDFEGGEPMVTEVPVGRQPVSVSVHGSRAWIANRGEGTVAELSLDSASVVGCFDVGPRPVGVLASSEEVYVTLDGRSEIVALTASGGTVRARIGVRPRPRGMAIAADGSELYVTHFTSGWVSIVDPTSVQVLAEVSTNVQANIAASIVLDQTGQRAFLPQTLTNHSSRALAFDATLFPVVSLLDVPSRHHERSRRIALDVVDRPVGQPMDAVITPAGKLYVANMASNDLSIVDASMGQGLGHIEVGSAPRGLALSADGSRLFVDQSLAGSIAVIDTATDLQLTEVQVTAIPLSSQLLNGKRLFNSSDDPRMARDQWIACSSCHFDGEADGRTWFFPDGPRNTPSLRGAGWTLPWHWSGDLDELQDVESTIRIIQAGSGLVSGSDGCESGCNAAPPNAGRSEDLDDLAAWMASLAFLAPMELNEQAMQAADRGELLFHSPELGCGSCHPAPLYTDGLRHDVGTGDSVDERKGPAFDTPTLLGLATTSPYLHDGRAATLADVISSANPHDRHGRTSHLDTNEVEDLSKFLLSLPRARGTGRSVDDSRCGVPGEYIHSDDFERKLVET